ncbi:MAG: hypothetical protein CMP65_01630 [Flavobacteriales bacterium]|nr:hypothetical protein [Flavobacteriales bacterium]|tara:strand:+ start:3000 stop:4139 length:1140 start_codon:yes stop_codon:yes gene_type:complete
MFNLLGVFSNKFLFFLAALIIGSTLWYTNNLASQFKIEEEKKVALWARATKELSNLNNSNIDVGFIFDVVNNNTSIPAILVDDHGAIVHAINLNPNQSPEITLDLMQRRYPNQRIEIDLIDGTKNFIYYKDSKLLQRLKYFPVFMFSIIAAFMLVAYSAFSNARIAQQNKVWTGMAKETAHQIGTPLSSLMGWLEHLKEQSVNEDVCKEIENDLTRLSVIANRFSKIGSLPSLEKQDIIPIIDNSINYMKNRASSKITFQIVSQTKSADAYINKDLFEWVIENMMKNSIDVLQEKGSIVFKISNDKHYLVLDIIDNGKGIKKQFFNEIFQPGFTSKKRGWGLGLSLVKRIIKDYHNGKVRVVKSVPFKETIIRVLLNKK